MTSMAIVIGFVLSARSLDGLNPRLQWDVQMILGVSTSCGEHVFMVPLRGLSTAGQAGVLNSMFSIAEQRFKT